MRSPGIEEHLRIKAEGENAETCGISAQASGIEVESTSPVAKVLTAEFGEVQQLLMLDEGVGGVTERISGCPAITDIAVFRGGEGKRYVKSAHGD